MSPEPVLLEHPAPGVALFTLNRPNASNALDPAAIARLETILDGFDADAWPKMIVLAASGSRAFCGGGDLNWFASLGTRADVRAMSTRVTRLFGRLHLGPAFVLAAIDGAAVGGGCELFLACHYRVIAPHASVRLIHAERGLPPGWGSLGRLVVLVGRSRALELLFSARELTAEEALAAGLVEELAGKGTARDRALELAAAWSARGPLAGELIRLTRPPAPSAAAIEAETEAFVAAWRF